MRGERHLVIFARFPQAGAGKRRLAAGIGAIEAVRFQRVRLAVMTVQFARDRRWTTWLAVTPDRAGPWARGVPVIAQGRGDLGQRMGRVMTRLPRGAAIIVGADIPGITPAAIARGFRLLGNHDAVFGPAEDGGYWLVGLKRVPRVRLPFGNVRWSGPQALADTERNLAGATIAHVGTLADVDDTATLGRFAHWCRTIAAGGAKP